MTGRATRRQGTACEQIQRAVDHIEAPLSAGCFQGYFRAVTGFSFRDCVIRRRLSLAPGRFVVTGIEGNIAEDPEGTWIGKGWTSTSRANDPRPGPW